ncbi:MAG: molybdenum cofactor guanylyltransferase [Desulfuromonadales bacterium]|nr:molybdenum cofactor guanylyltransferase [Desulfuromonadales bacterium]
MTTGNPPPYLDVTGVILAGGRSSRMGRDKATLLVDGVRIFDRTRALLREFFPQVLIAGDRPDLADAQTPCFPDLYPGSALGGLYTGLYHAQTPYILAAACDIPYPDRQLLRPLLDHYQEQDVVVFRTREGLEPLFAIYGKRCLAPMRGMLENGNYRIYDFFPEVRTCYLDPEQFAAATWRRSLTNVNTPDEYGSLPEKK